MSAQFIKDKAREISYALIRVAFYVKRDDLRSRLESLAVELLENSSRVSVENSLENINKALTSVSVLDGLIRLGHSIYEIEPVNATILVRELDGLNSTIRQSGNSLADRDGVLPDLETFFQVKDFTAKQDAANASSLDSEIVSGSGNNGLNAAIRQAAIVNRIKSGNGCRLKDLLAEFPDVSERTIRYDLQRLCERGEIERVGNGGPASYYTIKVGVIN